MLGSCQKALHRHRHTDTRAEKELSIFALVSPPFPRGSRCQSPSWAPRRSPRKSKDCANNMQKSTSSFWGNPHFNDLFSWLAFCRSSVGSWRILSLGQSTTCAMVLVWVGECLKAFTGPADKHLERKPLARRLHPPLPLHEIVIYYFFWIIYQE